MSDEPLDLPPAVRHALSDLLDALRRSRAYFDAEQDWFAKMDAWLRAGAPGEPPEPESEVEWVPDGAWQNSARESADHFDNIGRPDLAKQVRAILSKAPDMRAALDSAVAGTRWKILTEVKSQVIARKRYRRITRDEKEAQRNALEQYRDAKKDERIALKRMIEHAEWLLEREPVPAIVGALAAGVSTPDAERSGPPTNGQTGQPDSAESVTLDNLRDLLTKQQYRLVEYLWNRPSSVLITDLIERVWGKDIQPETVIRTVGKLKQRLTERNIDMIDLTIRNDAVKLVRYPDVS